MSKFIFIIAISLLLFAALSMVTNHQGFSVKILIACFWILLGAFLVYFMEIYHEKNA